MTHHRHNRAQELADKARETLGPAAEQARDKAAPAFNEAMERIAPIVEEARIQASEILRPVAAAAAARSEPYREEAKRRGVATVAALKGEVEAPTEKSHKLRTVVLVLGLGGAVAWGYKWFTGRDADAAWQSSYDPMPAPPSGTPEEPDDAAAAAPDEALADADEQPHDPTDPDHPLERREL